MPGTGSQLHARAGCVLQVSQHLLSNISAFTSLFLADTYRNSAGMHFDRSPSAACPQSKNPNAEYLRGALDRCTPSEEAQQFHKALRENGAPSVLATYPQEGHGIRHNPATIDHAARLIECLDRFLNHR